MLLEEFLKILESKKNIINLNSGANERDIEFAQANLMQIKCSMLSPDLVKFYKRFNGLSCQDSVIYGLKQIENLRRGYFIPSILDVNKDMMTFSNVLKGKTIIAKNSLFWFAVSLDGFVWMLDLMTLTPVKKYTSIYQAFYDCILVGEI